MTMPTPAIAKAAEELNERIHAEVKEFLGNDQFWFGEERLREFLTRHFAPATAADEGLFILGQGPHGPVTFIPDSRGGHIEFQGKVWRVEK